jgi:hypothetical protein
MTDLEISKSLALAIGWPEDRVTITTMSVDGGVTWVDACVSVRPDGSKFGRPFWYTDWNVIGPIAERYDCFPFKHQDKGEPMMWHTFDTNTGVDSKADTPQKAIALAVLKGAKK